MASGEFNRITGMLKASFGAIKQDIHSLKANQELQINGTNSLKEEINQLQDSFVHKIELKKELIDFDRSNVQIIAKEVETLKRTNEQLVTLLNQRIRDMNEQFSDVEQMRKELGSKIISINTFESALKVLEKDMNDNFGTLNKRMVTEAQVRKLVEDLNGELDRIKEVAVSKKEFEKKIAKIEKKL